METTENTEVETIGMEQNENYEQDADIDDNTKGKTENENITTYDMEDDNISVENESPEDAHLTINNINTIEQMNEEQINRDPETSDDHRQQKCDTRHG